MSRRFRTRMVMNIVYSTVVACLVEVFLIANVSMISSYLRETRYRDSFFLRLTETETLMAFVYLLSGIAIFSVTFFALQERSMRYISRISSAIQNISEGDLNTTIEVRGDDEFTAMAVNLNKMVGDIRNLMDKEREAERTKNELITNVAHDLRTPLTSIIGYLELLSGKVEIPAEMQKKYIDIAYAKSKRLEKLIEDLFGFTKMNYGKVAMHVSKVDIVKLLSQLLEEFYPSFKDKNLSYELQSNVPGKVITADGNLLARLFDNLINNAIKYGADGKRVLVQIHAEEEVGYYLAAQLSTLGMQVKIIEENARRCEELCELLPKATIINGDATDHDLLVEEGVEEADAFVALTGMDEENIILSLYAKSQNVDKIVAKVNEDRRARMVEEFGIDSIVSVKTATADAIMSYVRARKNSQASANIETMYQLVDDKVEALEFIIKSATEYTGIPLKDLALKPNNLIVCIGRKRQIILPSGEDCIEVGDSVVVITMEKHIEDIRDIMI